MTDQEIEDFSNTFDTIPNPVHYPKSFQNYVNVYRYIKTLNQELENESSSDSEKTG